VELKRKKAGTLLIILGNLVPLASVLWFGGDIPFLFAIFWAENVLLGLYTLARLLLNTGPAFPVFGRYGLAAFFVVNFGIFCGGHAAFVRTLFMRDRTVEFGDLNLVAQMQDFAGYFPDFTKAVLMLAVVQLMAFLTAYKKEPDFLTKPSIVQMFEPYPRLVLLHVTLIVGGAAIVLIGQPQWALIMLVALKTVMALGLWKYAPGDALIEKFAAQAQARAGQMRPPAGD